MSYWKKAKIKDVAEVKGGKRLPKGKKLIKEPNGHPYIRVKDLGKKKYLQLTSDFEYVDDETQQSISRYTVDKGDILISVVGTVGLVGIVGETLRGANQTENCDKIINIKGILPEYLYYYLKSNLGQDEIKKGIVGAVQPKLPLKNVKNISVLYPEIKKQEKIVSILGAIDEKIEINEKINENLFKQAQVLYQQSFPYTASDYLPDGWRIGTVSEIIEIHDSKRIPLSGAKRNKMKRKIYPYYGAASLMDYVDEYIFDGKYLLLGEDGTVSDDAGFPILQYVWGKFWVNNHAHILTGKLGYNVESLYTLFSQTSVNSIITGAVQPKISQASLKSIRVVLPPVYLIEKFNEQIEPMFTLIRNNRDENKRLSALRDTLLPKLISGELNISKIKV